MKRLIFLLMISCGLALPSGLMAQSYDHGEVGAFADYMNLSATDPHINFIGIGGRAAFNVITTSKLKPRCLTISNAASPALSLTE